MAMENEGISTRAGQCTQEWQGEEIDGRSILIFTEQGRGDIIQFARYLPLLVQRGARVSFFAPAEVIRLFRSLDAEIKLISSLSAGDPFDFQCALMSLPLRFGTDVLSIPNEVPYLRAERDLVTRWKARIGEHGFKIPAWQGSPQGKVDQGISIPVTEFVPLSRLSGVRLISLQKQHGLDLAGLPPGAVIEVLGEDFDQGPDAFIDTAAIMENLDLITQPLTPQSRIWRARWRSPPGWPSNLSRTGDGCWIGVTVPGIRRCACSGRKPPAIGHLRFQLSSKSSYLCSAVRMQHPRLAITSRRGI